MTSKNGSKKTSTSTILLPQPERLSVGQTESGLVKIEIKLRKHFLCVVEADGFTRYKMSSLVTETLKELPEAKTQEEQIRNNMITEVWVPLRACTSGDVPSLNEFFFLPKVDLVFWVATAKELGHTFEWLDGLEKIYASTLENMETEKTAEKKSETIP